MVSSFPVHASLWDDAQTMEFVEVPSPYSGIAKALKAAYRVSRMLPTELGKILGKMR